MTRERMIWMTTREAAVIMAYTGVALLVGDDLDIFHRYVQELMERPVWTHEFPFLADEIKRRAEPEFMDIMKHMERSDDHGK